jgi:hypothetical protein
MVRGAGVECSVRSMEAKPGCEEFEGFEECEEA